MDGQKATDDVEVQKRLEKILKEVNESYKEQLESSFKVTAEGGLQGLLKTPDKLMEMILKIKLRLYPAKFRFGIGFGEISDPDKMDHGGGSAYHLARQMMNEVRRIQSGKKALHADMQFGHMDRPASLDALNAGVCLMHFIEVGWTDKQRENIEASLFLKLNQSEIALKKNVNQSTVHRSLTAAGFYEYERAYLEFQRQLNRMGQDVQAVSNLSID